MLVYKIVNKVNNKVYIGITESTLEKRYDEHLSKYRNGDTRHLYQAMRKYGLDNFEVSVVEDNISSYKELLDKERSYVEQFNSYNNGYNMTPGGDSNPMNSKVVSDKHDAKMRSKEVRTKISNTMKEKAANGLLFSDEHKKHLTESLKDSVYMYNPNTNKMTRVRTSNIDTYLADGWILYEKRTYDESCGREQMKPLAIKTNMFATRQVPCYCILDNGERYDFPNIREAAIWWFENYHPFGEHFAECTYQRKIKKSMLGQEIKFETQTPGQHKTYKIITNIKWYKKEVVL